MTLIMNNPGLLSSTLDPALLGKLKTTRHSLSSVKSEIYYLESQLSAIIHNPALLHMLLNANEEELNTILSSINPKILEQRLGVASDTKINLERNEQTLMSLANNVTTSFSYNDIINFLKSYQYIPA